MTRRRGSAIPILNGAVAVVLVVLVAGVAAVVRPPAPPGIAEFAPRASKPIVHAPSGQVAQLDRGGRACQASPACAPRGASPSPTGSSQRATGRAGLPGVASALQCHTWPDGSVTQTFDPQSPPCVAAWPEAARGNGGATSPGVTESEIVVAAFLNPKTVDPMQRFVRFLNSRYQLYGRKIRLVVKTPPPGSTSPEGQAGLAATARQLGAFAAAGIDPFAADASTYVQKLAGFGIVSLDASVRGAQRASVLTRAAPFAWSYVPPVATMEGSAGRLVCSALAGRRARWAGPAYQQQTRKFAIGYSAGENGSHSQTDVSALREALSDCGIAVRTVGFPATFPDPGWQAQLASLRTSDVTTVLYVGRSSGGASALTAASTIGYQPEWMLVGGAQIDNDYVWQSTPADQTSHLFALGYWDRINPLPSEPWYEALVATGGSYDKSGSAQAQDGRPVWVMRFLYHELAILAAGVQAAGPDLTPASFARGLHGLTFPNPGAGAAPSYQATVGFGTTDPYVMQRDYTLAWWGQAAPSYTGLRSRGGWCYLDRGTRFRYGDSPRTEPELFTEQTCR